MTFISFSASSRLCNGLPIKAVVILSVPAAFAAASFFAQAARQPLAVALSWGEERLGYGELARRVRCLAHRLVALGIGPEVVVAITAERRSGAVMSAKVRSRVAPSMRPASSSSGWTAWKADESCW